MTSNSVPIHPPNKLSGTLGTRMIVKYNNKEVIVKTVHCYGKRIIIDDGITKPKSVKIQDVKLVMYGKGLHFEVMSSIPIPFENGSILEVIL